MKKTDKKIDNAIRIVLTEVCDGALNHQDGFQWLTHIVNYDDFPNSLQIICVYGSNDQLAKANKEKMYARIKSALSSIDVRIKNIQQHVSFDTEENCENDNKGNWSKRLQKH